jgi:hypothetical protein
MLGFSLFGSPRGKTTPGGARPWGLHWSGRLRRLPCAARCSVALRNSLGMALQRRGWHANGSAPVPGFAAGGTRRGRSLRWRGAQSWGRRALRASSTDSPQLFERSAQRVASSAARPRIEHHSGVGATRQPPQCEPPSGTACREAASEKKDAAKSQPPRLQACIEPREHPAHIAFVNLVLVVSIQDF